MSEHELTQEEEYFMKRDAELRQRMREDMEAKAAKAALAEEIGSDDNPELLDRLRRLGIDADAARGLHLMPLVEVAWADGTVSQQERVTIMRAAAAHGIAPGSEAGHFLATLLEKRPSTELMANIRGILKDLLAAQGVQPDNLIEACHTVAEASGGFLGLGNRVSEDEQRVIDQIAKRLNTDAQAAVAQQLR